MIERSAGEGTTTTTSELSEAFHARSVDRVRNALDTKHEGPSSADAASRCVAKQCDGKEAIQSKGGASPVGC